MSIKSKVAASTSPPAPKERPRDDFRGHVFGIDANIENTEEEANCCRPVLIGLSYFLFCITIPFSLCFCFKVVQEYERAVIFRLGRLSPGGPKGPGVFFILPCIDDYICVDLRIKTGDVPPQEVLTRDSVSVQVDAVVYYRISEPTIAVANVQNAEAATELLSMTTLRNVVGQRFLHEVLSERELLAKSMGEHLKEVTEKWGIEVDRVEIQDIRLPAQMQRAMAAEAEAIREAKAKVIDAEGELKAARNLKEASDVIASSPAALQLRYFQTLNAIVTERQAKIIFPLPLDLFSFFMKTKK